MNPIFESFLRRQYDCLMKLAEESDIVKLEHVEGEPPQLYIIRFQCKGLIREKSGEIRETHGFTLGIHFEDQYLRRFTPGKVISILDPPNVFHPNVKWPAICIGGMFPGTGITELIYQAFEILTYQKATVREDDALDPIACQYSRNHQERFPIDPRPLKRNIVPLKITKLMGR
ncbi:MAG: hypothetical protein JXR73_21315 [Candidatus Omnitrophica bacterium]|nr:hypothetical protein [Candidatus Omnitrophota bacterium]